MFLEKYLSEFYLNQVLDNYDHGYLNTLDEENFVLIYNLFKKYNFYFVDDIVLNYLEIFFIKKDELEEKILKLKKDLGNKFVYIIGNNMQYLDIVLEK